MEEAQRSSLVAKRVETAKSDKAQTCKIDSQHGSNGTSVGFLDEPAADKGYGEKLNFQVDGEFIC